jgi:hypothetical protein
MLQRNIEVKGQSLVRLLRDVIKHTCFEGQECTAWRRLHCISADICSFKVWGAVSNSLPAGCLARLVFSFLVGELYLNL